MAKVRVKKVRKPRGMKLSGRMSLDMCPHCGRAGCDPFAHQGTLYEKKLEHRLKNKLCIGCGHDPCTCKSSLDVKPFESREQRRIAKENMLKALERSRERWRKTKESMEK